MRRDGRTDTQLQHNVFYMFIFIYLRYQTTAQRRVIERTATLQEVIV